MSESEHNDKFDTFLAREAAAYHRPPGEVPREEMWTVIARARAASRVKSVAPRGARSIRFDARRRVQRYAPWIGMAATLIVGVGIGRFVLARNDGAGDTRDLTRSAVTTATDVLGAAADASAPVSESVPSRTAATTAAPSAMAASAVRREAAQGRFVPTRTASGRPSPRDAEPLAGDIATNTSYRVATQEHLVRAEALVAVVAATPADAIMDSLMGRWARDVLSNTRLLLDSPAGADPVRRRLLEDLETLLVQLVQRSGHATEERAMIDRTLQRTQLLTRLRSGAAGT